MALVEVRNLWVDFETPEATVHALDEVTFSIERGRTLGLVGESGCGKSVTARAMLGLLRSPPAVVRTGQVVVDGRDLMAMGEAELRGVRGREVALVPQDPTTAFHPLLTVGRQLTEVLEVHEGLRRRAADDRAAAALAEVGFGDARDVLHRYPHELSGGMRQRAMIAMALLCRPKLLIADEPTTALDVTLQAQILRLFRELQDRHGSAVLFVTHDLGVAAEVCDDVAVMYAGRIVESAPTRELFALALHPFTRGLLRARPRLDAPVDQGLAPIPGRHPELLERPPGCPFVERCEFALGPCHDQRPPFELWSLAGTARALHGRRVACFEARQVAAAQDPAVELRPQSAPGGRPA